MGKIAKDLPSQIELRRIFRYEDGKLYWRESNCGRRMNVPAGTKASNGYIKISLMGYGSLPAHRLIWTYHNGPIGYDEDGIPLQIDHKNAIRDDNIIENLRLATPSQNARNRGLNKTNTSGVTGVYWNKRHSRWRVQVTIDGCNHNVGHFRVLEDAIAARRKAEREAYGRFARVV